MKNSMMLLFCSLVFAAQYSVCIEEKNSSNIKHFIQATQEFEGDRDEAKFDLHKARIRDYYNSDEYDNEVISVCQKAESYFNQLTATSNSLVIFDVDDTAIRVYPCWETNMLGINAPLSKIIVPVLNLYKLIISKGFKVIFITGRSAEYHERTKQQLIDAGYIDFVDLHCMPKDLQNHATRESVGTWKYSVREKIAEKYDIVGSFGDRDIDFVGGLSGYEVRLPNYLY